jgi:hypothetical protein
VLRLLLVILCLLTAVIWVDASWSSEQRSLVLRLREGSEIVEVLRDRSRALGSRVVDRVRDRLPAVGASRDERKKARKRADRAAGEGITSEDQEKLDRLIAETTRER